ncbi:DUF4440 domain-containing protein [Sphingomonas jatrophae]|uniref:DUF4440 domain-containing protein n=1 Tax=Sphingomonas jatrophae TaxID=1166337 RepID=A0A1I6L5N4_9SPHN|nr:DUF4440 domain-containing protein [Sphingomonas jatrophae]SFR98717.1 protein of unknown function [Sphingomonas jatrophae]
MPAGDAAGAICLLRARHNAALTARDLAGAVALTVPDSVLVTGDGSLVRGAKAIRAAWAASFAQPGYAGYRRSPDLIQTSEDGTRAAESGRWEGLLGPVRSAGTYLAHWEARAEGWRVVAELYVTLEEAPRAPA